MIHGLHIFAFGLSFLLTCAILVVLYQANKRDYVVKENFETTEPKDTSLDVCLPNPSWTILDKNDGRLTMCVYTPYIDVWKRISDSTVIVKDPSMLRNIDFNIYSSASVMSEKAWEIISDTNAFVMNGVSLDRTTITGPQMSSIKVDTSVHIGDMSIVWNMSYSEESIPENEELLLLRLPMTGTAGTSYFKIILVKNGDGVFVNVNDEQIHTWKIPSDSQMGSNLCLRRKINADGTNSTLGLAIDGEEVKIYDPNPTDNTGTTTDNSVPMLISQSNSGRLFPSTELIRVNPNSQEFGDVKLMWLGISHKYIAGDVIVKLRDAIRYETSGNAETCRRVAKDGEASVLSLKKSFKDQLAKVPECPTPGNAGGEARPSWFIDLLDVLGAATNLSEVPESICELKVIPSGMESEYVDKLTKRPGFQHLTMPAM